MKPRIRNSVGCASGFCGLAGWIKVALAFSLAESAVAIRITARKIAIMIFGNPNASMKIVAKVI